MDTESLIRLLNDHGVDYVIIGAAAFPVHGYARATLDIDIFIRPVRENAECVHEALSEYGYDISDVTVDDLLSSKLLIRQYALQTDVHPFVEGVTFEEIWDNRVTSRIGDTPTNFASLEDLISMKEAAGRPKDLEDLKYLRRIRDRAGG
jgi:predicted nucleotidyltransferase